MVDSETFTVEALLQRVGGQNPSQEVPARVSFTAGGPAVCCSIEEPRSNMTIARGTLACDAVWQASEDMYFLKVPEANGQTAVYCLRCTDDSSKQLLTHVGALAARHHPAASGAAAAPATTSTANGDVGGGGAGRGTSSGKDGGGGGGGSNLFDAKTDAGSAELYFHYYGMLQHQQNMLQDYVRTGAYYSAILENSVDFAGAAVADIGAGSGILSLFSAQAGARVVYAAEASGMAKFAAQLAAANPRFGSRVKVLQGKVEVLQLPEKVDILVSEPMGTLLVNERMLETYLYARDNWLKPGGRMFPQLGRIHVAAFSDAVLHAELAGKAAFWMQPDFYNVDVTTLHQPAVHGYYGQVVVDAIDPSLICSTCATHMVDFRTVTERQLYNISIPLQLVVQSAVGAVPGTPMTVHGVACWFDVQFQGSASDRWLSTAPGMATTHWFQLRCVLEAPLAARVGDMLQGELLLVSHARQSYDVHLNLQGPPLTPGAKPQAASGKFDLKEPYYRQLTTWWNTQGQQVMGDGTA